MKGSVRERSLGLRKRLRGGDAETRASRRGTALTILLVAVFVVGAFGFSVLTIVKPFRELLDRDQRITELHDENDEYREDIAELRDRRDALYDEETIEEIAREQRGLVRPGEKPVILVPPETQEPARASAPTEDDVSGGGDVGGG